MIIEKMTDEILQDITAHCGSNSVFVIDMVFLSAVTSSGTDMAAATGYGKTHTQSFDKAAGFAAGTPPPFNLALSSGSQAGHMGPTATYGAPYMPVMAHLPHSQMQHHHLQQVRFRALTHWLLGDLDAILKMEFSILFYWLGSSDLLMIMPSDECHRTLLMICQHWFR